MLKIRKSIHESMVNYLDRFDYEEGGVLLGEDGVINEFIPMTNVSSMKQSLYKMEPGEWLQIFKKNKDRILGTIHSHTVKLATPSKTDVSNLCMGITLIYSKQDKLVRAFKINRNISWFEDDIEIIK